MEPRPLNTKIVYVAHLPEYCPGLDMCTNSMSAKICPRSWTVGVGKTDQIEKKIAIDIEKKDVENYKNAK